MVVTRIVIYRRGVRVAVEVLGGCVRISFREFWGGSFLSVFLEGVIVLALLSFVNVRGISDVEYEGKLVCFFC